MTAEQALSTARTILHYIGTALCVVTLAKFFGANIPLAGDLQTLALVALATRMA